MKNHRKIKNSSANIIVPPLKHCFFIFTDAVTYFLQRYLMVVPEKKEYQ